jgi:hypothetical protein
VAAAESRGQNWVDVHGRRVSGGNKA